MFITFVGCSSCVNSSYLFGPGDIFRNKRKSFIKIDVRKNIQLTKTTTISEEIEAEINLMGSSSGFIVGHDREVSLVATSAHVCTVSFGNQIKYFVREYSKHEPSWKLTETSSYRLNDHQGNIYMGTPIEYDLRADICILATTLMPLPALTISRTPPLIGEKYYNIAAPMGLWTTKMIPLFEGFYLGAMKTRADRKLSYAFSIPVKGGSSGSPILNSYGEVVGAVHSKYKKFDNLCLATTNDQIYSVYRKSLLKLLKDYDKYNLLITVINL